MSGAAVYRELDARDALEGLAREMRAAYFQTYASTLRCPDANGWRRAATQARRLCSSDMGPELRSAYLEGGEPDLYCLDNYWQRVADRALEWIQEENEMSGEVGARLVAEITREQQAAEMKPPDWLMFSVWVPGKAQSQGSKVRTNWGVRESNKELGPWRERVALAASQIMVKNGWAPVPAGEPLRLVCEFVLPRPKSAPKRSTPPATQKPDLLKCARGIEDALTGVVYHDDSQIVSEVLDKRRAEIDEPPGVNVRVERMSL